MGERPLFTGELVELRPLSRDHIETYLRWINDPDVTRTLYVHGTPMTREKEEDWYGRVSFTLEGRRRQALFREGRYWDMLVMSILSEEWTG